MVESKLHPIVLQGILLIATSVGLYGQIPYYDQTREGFLVFHPIATDSEGRIVPWMSADRGKAYDFVVRTVWDFWHSMRTDVNGLPYYMNHQVWRPENDPRGLGGDQFAMALSSWQLLYRYSGDERVKENMKFIADYYLTHSLSPSHARWPSLPFPYNTLIYSGFYDGDMVIGKDFTQPDKAGSFGFELVNLYKMTGNARYLDAAVAIANTLADHVEGGDADNSPLPFKVNVFTGEIGPQLSNRGNRQVTGRSSYTTNWAGTLELWLTLIDLREGRVNTYQQAFDRLLAWMIRYPMANAKWGPFFEDIPGWSDTQINAVTFARFILLHRNHFPDWKNQVRAILDWVYTELGDDSWTKYGVRVVREQTAYLTPGNSHTSRQAAAELLYASLSGDNSGKENAIRQLDWATYMVDGDGKNCYPRDEVWLTDGYGDYVRHYLRAMAAEPELAPSSSDHILDSTAILSQVDYSPDFNKRLSADVPADEAANTRIFYRGFGPKSVETIRMATKPSRVLAGKEAIPERRDLADEGWTWQAMESGGGLLRIRHDHAPEIRVVSP